MEGHSPQENALAETKWGSYQPKFKSEDGEELPHIVPSSNSTILLSTPAWKACGNLDFQKQVLVQELAVKIGEDFLDKLESSLVTQSMHLRSATKWIERISKSHMRF